MYGTKYTLTESQQTGGRYDLLLTAPDGTVWQYAEPADGQAYATGPWEKTTLADGQTTVVSWIDADGQRSSGPMPGDQAMVVDQYATATATAPEEEDQYTFTTDPVTGVELCSSITYLYWNSTVSNGNGGNGALVYGKQVQYAYYGQGDPNGLPGDLEFITTQYPSGTVVYTAPGADNPGWTGSDTYYFRYYTGSGSGGFADGLRDKLLPAAYSSLAAYAAGLGESVDAVPDAYVDTHACFYYQYNNYNRVTSETVFGDLRTTTFQYIEGTDSQTDTNAWTRETIETNADGSTYTVYSNYLGETLLDDLYDPTDSAHPDTYTYYEYDSCGDVTLQASSSSITGYWNGQSDTAVGVYDGTIVPQTDFHIHLGLPATPVGPVEEFTYQYVYVSQFNTPSGLLESTSVADGLSLPSSSGSYYNSTTTLQESYTYTAHSGQNADGVGDTMYPMASDTVYANTDGSRAETTRYAYTWYPGTLQEQTVTATLPVVTPVENGSGVAATTADWDNSQGNVVWSEDANGYLTCYGYDPVSGLLTEMIHNVNSSTTLPSGVSLPTGWSFPAQNGPSATTDYSYDNQGRLDQTLGPAHTAVVNGAATSVRTASWTYYDDADNTTVLAQGYVTQDTSGNWTVFTLVNPVSVTISNPDGQVTSQIEAAVDVAEGTGGMRTVGWVVNAADTEVSLGSLSPLALLANTTSGGIGLPPQSAYTAWTTYEYSHKQLVSTRVYYSIPSNSIGTAATSYDETDYGYNAVGNLEWSKTPAGTINWNVLNANDLTMSTWVGTSNDGATAFAAWLLANPSATESSSTLAGTNMVDTTDYQYDCDGDVTSVTQHVGGARPTERPAMLTTGATGRHSRSIRRTPKAASPTRRPPTTT